MIRMNNVESLALDFLHFQLHRSTQQTTFYS